MLERMVKFKKVISLLWNINFLRKDPVIILAPGHVGSMALHKGLAATGILVFKVEFMDIGESGAADFIKKNIFSERRPAKIITIVRDPILMMISYFFSKASANHLPEAHIAWKEKNVDKLQELFIKNVLGTDRLDSHLYWYENDFLRATGIDIYAHPFDANLKTGYIEHDLFPTLIIRTEMEDDVKANIIAEFLKIPLFTLTRENTRSKKIDASLYEEFKESLTIPDEIIDKIYSSRLCTHFLHPTEIASAQKRWSKG